MVRNWEGGEWEENKTLKNIRKRENKVLQAALKKEEVSSTLLSLLLLTIQERQEFKNVFKILSYCFLLTLFYLNVFLIFQSSWALSMPPSHTHHNTSISLLRVISEILVFPFICLDHSFVHLHLSTSVFVVFLALYLYSYFSISFLIWPLFLLIL